MPDITHPYTIVNGDVSVADEIAQNIFRAGVVPVTGEVINGHLDADNFQGPNPKVFREHIQPGALSRAKMVGSTLDRDYFRETMLGYRQASTNNVRRYIPVPGACQSFFIPENVTALVYTWQIHFENDDRADLNHFGYFKFVIGDNFDLSPLECMREIPGGVLFATNATKASMRQGHYAGHYTSVEPSSGWQSAGLYCAHEYREPQLRIHVCNIKAIALR